MMERVVLVPHIVDGQLKYRRINDCYVCVFDTGGKYSEHYCGVTGEFLHVSGKVDIDVPESCPYAFTKVDVEPVMLP
jgi:hypothetical protein